jgi:hypothetical protein
MFKNNNKRYHSTAHSATLLMVFLKRIFCSYMEIEAPEVQISIKFSKFL